MSEKALCEIDILENIYRKNWRLVGKRGWDQEGKDDKPSPTEVQFYRVILETMQVKP